MCAMAVSSNDGKFKPFLEMFSARADRLNRLDPYKPTMMCDCGLVVPDIVTWTDTMAISVLKNCDRFNIDAKVFLASDVTHLTRDPDRAASQVSK